MVDRRHRAAMAAMAGRAAVGSNDVCHVGGLGTVGQGNDGGSNAPNAAPSNNAGGVAAVGQYLVGGNGSITLGGGNGGAGLE